MVQQEHPEPTVTTHQRKAILFTSATLGTPDLAPFMRDHGLPHALQMQVESPFDYKRNSLLYVPDNNAPNTKSGEFLDFMVSQMETMVHSAGGGAFLLFTSNAALRYAVDKLRKPLERAGFPCYVQGEGYSKLEIINQVKAHGNAVLFATKSFFEGVDIQGDALRLVIIDKMPFAAPSPYSNAQHEHIREWARQNLKLSDKDLEWYPFNAKSIPDMIIDLKQGAGRLIRSHKDRGVIAVLDNRLLTTQYGRSKVLPSLPDSPLVRNLTPVQNFFNPPVESTPLKDLTPLELAKQLYAIEL
jgi:ATP-dependent DNA helicase DinG